MNKKNYYFPKYINLITHPIFAVLWIGFAMGSYFFLDKPIAIYMHHLNNAYILNTAQFVTKFGLGGYYIGLTILAIIIGHLIWPQAKMKAMALYFLLAVLIPGAICDAIKIVVSRARPTELFHHQLYGFYYFHFKASMWSFPSGHATTIAGVMMLASLLWPKYWPGFVGVMLLVAVSRVIITAHYLSDVMIGLYLGSIVTVFMMPYLQRIPWLELALPNGLSLGSSELKSEQ